MPAAIYVKGLRDLERAFKLAGPAANKELRQALTELGEPIRRDAERLARTGIRNIGEPWSQMRTGVTQKAVYVAPRQRGGKSRANRALRRPNLFDLLMGRSLEPALEKNLNLIQIRVDNALQTVGKEWERV